MPNPSRANSTASQPYTPLNSNPGINLQRRIINELRVRPSIAPAQEVARRVQFLVDYAQATGTRGFTLGISGGQDSTLAGRLCQLAVEQLGKDYRFFAMRLPYGVQADESDAQIAMDFIAPSDPVVLNIKPATDALAAAAAECVTTATSRRKAGGQREAGGQAEIDAQREAGGQHKKIAGLGEPISDFNKGNVKARQRMVAQYAVAAETGTLVVGTDHAAEAVTGFFTKFGDGAADVMPLAGLTKRQGALLLEHLGAPSSTWLKVPTADLEENRPALPDEEALGVSYADIDAYLEGHAVPEAAAARIEHLWFLSRHKRTTPITPADTWWREPNR